MTKHSADFLTMSARPDGAGSVRNALRSWLPWLSAGEAAEFDDEGRAEGAREIAAPFENEVRMLRANARAAYRCVEGAREIDGCDGAALEAALDVVEAAWRSAIDQRNAHAEALKAIRLYASDPRCRAMAAGSLAGSGARRGARPLPGDYDA
jgi:hypothetical protein